jgi:murein L,D-transpeptidase YafK
VRFAARARRLSEFVIRVKNFCEIFSHSCISPIASKKRGVYDRGMKWWKWMLLLLAGMVYLLVQQSDFSLAMDPLPSTSPLGHATSHAVTAPAGAARAKAASQRVKDLLAADLAEKGLRWGAPVFLRAFKEEGSLELFLMHAETKQYLLFRTYRIAAQSGTLGPKLREGDGQVPEGFYAAGKRSMKPDSRFHLAFNVGYPNEYDVAHQRTGSFIMIHGNEVSIGCLAMTDELIEEIYSLCDAALENGQPFFRIHFFPFRMTADRMEKARESEHYAFWENLREGYDLFEWSRIPPETSVRDKRYQFRAAIPSSDATR